MNLCINKMLVDLQEDISQVAVDFKGNCIVQVIFPGKGSRLMIDELQSTVVRIENNEFCELLEWFLLFNVYRDDLQVSK